MPRTFSSISNHLVFEKQIRGKLPLHRIRCFSISIPLVAARDIETLRHRILCSEKPRSLVFGRFVNLKYSYTYVANSKVQTMKISKIENDQFADICFRFVFRCAIYNVSETKRSGSHFRLVCPDSWARDRVPGLVSRALGPGLVGLDSCPSRNQHFDGSPQP